MKLSSAEDLIKLQDVVLKTVGVHSDEAASMFFDYNMAVNSYKLYDYKDIPTIPISSIPPQVSSVHFRSDLTEVTAISTTGYSTDSMLFNSL